MKQKPWAEQSRQSIEWVRTILKEYDSELAGDAYNAAMVLLSSLIVGPDIDRVIAFTGLDSLFVKQVADRLVANGIWVEGGVHADWSDPEDGGIALALDIAVAQGKLERAGDGFIEPQGNN